MELTGSQIGLVIVFTIEFMLSQRRQRPTKTRYSLYTETCNLLLNISFCIAMVTSLPAPALLFVALAWASLDLVLDTYLAYSGIPLSGTLMAMQVKDAAKVIAQSLSLVPGRSLLRVTFFFVLKVILIVSSFFRFTIVSIPIGILGVTAISSSVFVAAQCFRNYRLPLKTMGTCIDLDFFISRHGNVVARLAQFFLLNQRKVINSILQTVHEFEPTFKLTLKCAPRHIVVIQVESLDYKALGLRVDGLEVTPFLNRMAEQGCLTDLRSYHSAGSSDADFTFLSGLKAGKDIATYRLTHFPFEAIATMPKTCRDFGYHTLALHGVSGNFYNRRGPFVKMGFNEVYFLEELLVETTFKPDHWGIRDPDLLAFGNTWLEKANQPTFLFIITVTSHKPFNYCKLEEQRIFPQPKNIKERYINSISMVDQSLQDFTSSLTKDTLVILYGDHPSGVWDREEGDSDDCVPLFAWMMGPSNNAVPVIDQEETQARPVTLFSLHHTLIAALKEQNRVKGRADS